MSFFDSSLHRALEAYRIVMPCSLILLLQLFLNMLNSTYFKHMTYEVAPIEKTQTIALNGMDRPFIYFWVAKDG